MNGYFYVSFDSKDYLHGYYYVSFDSIDNTPFYYSVSFDSKDNALGYNCVMLLRIKLMCLAITRLNFSELR